MNSLLNYQKSIEYDLWGNSSSGDLSIFDWIIGLAVLIAIPQIIRLIIYLVKQLKRRKMNNDLSSNPIEKSYPLLHKGFTEDEIAKMVELFKNEGEYATKNYRESPTRTEDKQN